MGRTLTHPLSDHPLDQLKGKLECSLPNWHRTYLAILMLENSVRQCSSYVKGVTLDVGCGQRPYEKTFFAGATKYIGTDYLSDRSRPDVISSALEVPFSSDTFDTVVSTEVLEHVPDPARALREMHRILKPGGHLILSTPMYWPRHEAPYDFFRYPYDGMLHLLEQSQFELVKMYNRGRSYAFLGQVLQTIHPVSAKPITWLINQACLWCDRHLKHDVITMGWTVVARKRQKVSGAG